MPVWVDSFHFRCYIFFKVPFNMSSQAHSSSRRWQFSQRHLFTLNYASEPPTRSELISILPDKMFNKLLFLGNKCNSSEKRKPKLLWTSKCRNVQNERLWVVPADKHISLCRTRQRHAAVKHAESKHPNTITSIVVSASWHPIRAADW